MKTIADVACYAEEQGYLSYNQALAQFEKDGIIPGYEEHVLDVYDGIGNTYGWSEITCKIFDGFIEAYNVDSVSLD
jgi:hypothetical protein